MSMRMLIDARHPEETRVAVIQGNRIEEFDFESAQKEQLKGNIYLAKVTRVEPSLQAAFVEYGGNRHGFLAFSEIHPDYYQIPKEDREALLREEREAVEAHRAEIEAETLDEDAEQEAGEGESENGPASEVVHDHHEDQASEALRAKRQNLRRRYKIQEVIKRRQVLLVQVVKEERGNKGAALTTYLSLAGRYCVFMPNTNHGGGISRKISSQADRKRLKSIVSELKLPTGMGCIIRTAGLSRTKAEIKRDFDYLTRLWDEIREATLASTAPALIHEDSDLIKRAIRDIYNRDIDEVLVDGEEGYKKAKNFMKLLMPSHAKKVQQYIDPVPLFQRYQVEPQLAAMYHPVVQLKSGGYLVINPTEALVSIDINSGKSTREHNIEETALKTNVEAAKEIARQLRLRDMAGLVVIDFIDMDVHANNRKVERALKEALKNDRARIQVGRISTFGLLEMSRQRLRTGVLEASTHVCPTCDGAGIVRTVQSAALGALRVLEAEALRGRHSTFTLSLPFDVAVYMLNRKRGQVSRIEDLYGVAVDITPDAGLHTGEHEIEGSGPPPSAKVDLSIPVAPALEPEEEIHEDDLEDEDEAEAHGERGRGEREEGERGERRRRRRRRGRRGREDGREAGEPEATPLAETEEAGEAREDHHEHDEHGEGGARRRRRRGRRGGRRRGGEAQREAHDAVEPGMDTEEAGEQAAADPELPVTAEATAEAETPLEAMTPAEAEAEAPAEKPKRTRRRKTAAAKEAPAQEAEATPEAEAAPAKEKAAEEPAAEEKPKRTRRRKPAAKAEAETPPEAPAAPEAEAAQPEPANDPEPDAASEAPAEGPPPRKGWWQKTFGN